jgi:OOP family OmpA-OmpF porin
MKRKTLSSLIVVMVFCFSIKAQNLVPNYSFEDTIQCISGANQFQGYVSDWVGLEVENCYFTSRCNESGDSVPSNQYGYQYPHTGEAYAGMFTFEDDTDNGSYVSVNFNFRDYIQTKLLDSLKTGIRYYVDFYVSLSDSAWFYCNDIGAYFSDSALNYVIYNHVKSYLTPQIANDPVKNPLTDTKNWMKISGSFIAKGGEKYIIIGNFKNDSSSHVVYKGQLSTSPISGAYYFIDDVIVSTDSNYADSLESVNQLTINNAQLKVYPNPSNGKFTIEEQGARDKEQVEIYNMMGKRVYNEALRPTSFRGGQVQGDIQIDLSNQPAGIYLYRIVSEKGEAIGTGKLIIQ